MATICYPLESAFYPYHLIIETERGKITSSRNNTILRITPYGSNTTQLEIKGPAMYDDTIQNDDPLIFQVSSIWRDNPSHPVTVKITAVTNASIFQGMKLPPSDKLPVQNTFPSKTTVSSTVRLNVLSLYESILDKFSALNASGAVDIIIAIGGAISGFVVGVIAKTKSLGALFKWSKDKDENKYSGFDYYK